MTEFHPSLRNYFTVRFYSASVASLLGRQIGTRIPSCEHATAAAATPNLRRAVDTGFVS